MRLRFEIEFARLAPAANFLVVLGALPIRNTLVGQIWNSLQKFAQLLILRLSSLIKLGNFGSDLFHLRNQPGGVLLLPLQRCYFIRYFVTARFARLRFNQKFAALAVE